MGNIGPLELGIVLVIVLLIFGPKRLPGLGRQLGSGMREFKDSITGSNKDDDDDEGEGVAGLPAAPRAEPRAAATSAPVAATVAQPAVTDSDAEALPELEPLEPLEPSEPGPSGS